MKIKKDKLQEKIEEKSLERAWKIKYYLQGESIYTPSSKLKNPFYNVIIEVLERLPDEIFDIVEKNIRFILESSPMWTMNFHFKKSCPQTLRIFPRKIEISTIILFHSCLELNRKALIGVIANEIAHCVLVYYPTRHMLGKTKKDLTKAWGFAIEIEEMKKAKK